MEHPGTGYLKELEQMMRQKWRLQPVYARVRLPDLVVGMTAEWINTFVMRALLEARPELVNTVLSTREALFTTSANAPRYAGLFGETVIALKAWDVAALGRRLPEGTDLPHGVQLLSYLDDFTPGEFQRARMRITLDAAHFPDAGRELRRYLQDQYVPVNLRGVADGYVFDIPAKARRKRVIFAGEFQERDGRFQVEFVVSPKFDLVDYLRSFSDPGRYREAKAEVVDLEL
jgi:hypothetical protein